MPVMIVLELLRATTPEPPPSLGIKFLTMFGARLLGSSSKLPAVGEAGGDEAGGGEAGWGEVGWGEVG